MVCVVPPHSVLGTAAVPWRITGKDKRFQGSTAGPSAHSSASGLSVCIMLTRPLATKDLGKKNSRPLGTPLSLEHGLFHQVFLTNHQNLLEVSSGRGTSTLVTDGVTLTGREYHRLWLFTFNSLVVKGSAVTAVMPEHDVTSPLKALAISLQNEQVQVPQRPNCSSFDLAVDEPNKDLKT